jgi:DNA polymerase III gamma/tau subunit
LAKDLTNYCRDLMLLTVGYASESTFNEADKAQRQEQAKSLGRDRLLGMVDALRTAEKDMRQSTDHRLLLELTLVRASANLLEAPKAIAPKQTTPQPQIPPKTPRPIPQPAIEHQPTPVKQPIAAAPKIERPPIEASAAPIETPPSAAPKKPSNSKGPGKGRRISDLEEFIELWPYVLLRIRKKISIPAVAYLHDAMPVELNETAAVLEFQKQFHYEKACEAAKQLPFEKVINECMAAPHQLIFQLAEPKAAPAPVAAPVQEEVEDDDEEEDVFKLAEQMLGAEVVEEI